MFRRENFYFVDEKVMLPRSGKRLKQISEGAIFGRLVLRESGSFGTSSLKLPLWLFSEGSKGERRLVIA